MIGLIFLVSSVISAAFGFVQGFEVASAITFAPLTSNPSFMMELSLGFLNTAWTIACAFLGLALYSLPFGLLASATLKPALMGVR